MESKINVTVRIKPLNEQEKLLEKNQLWQLIGESTIMNVRSKEMFSFDSVFGDGTCTQQIFDSQVKEQVRTAMQGINVTVFAYGQTSSGKTFTMRGNDKNLGLIPLSIQEVFSCIDNDQERDYEITVSYLEIYNETLNDLIDPNNKNLEIRESIAKGIYINRLKECNVNSREEIMKYMFMGDEAKIIAETKLNENSSRSHTVFRINIQSKRKGDETNIRLAQLNLVDLAGSEGASRTQTDGLRLREGSNINRSLLALSNVINRLSQAGNSKTFINYRDSKLTRILQPALGGNSKTAIICTITPNIQNYQETLNTLHFGQKAKHVKTTVNVNEICQLAGSGPEMERAQKEINELRAKLREFETKVLELQSCSSIISRINDQLDNSATDKLNLSIFSQQPGFTANNPNNAGGENTANANLGGNRPSIGSVSQAGANGDFTVLFLRDQLKFMSERMKKTTLDLEEKERVIQKMEHERRELERKYEAMELENFQMQEKMASSSFSIINSLKSSQVLGKSFDKNQFFKTPAVSKQQNKRVLEEDGIRCFDLDDQECNSVMGESDFLRMSIGIGQPRPQIQAGEFSEQLKLLSELEKLKRENDGLGIYVKQLEREKSNFLTDKDNHMALREELEMIKEEALMKDEELNKYQKHCHSLNDELQFYKDQNSDLLRRLDDCERTLTSDVENTSIVQFLITNHRETSKLLKDENGALKGQIQKLREEIKQLAVDKSKQESVKAELEYNQRASEYNVEILKNQIENLNNEAQMMRKQNEKQKKTIDILRQTNERLQQDLDHYKKLSLQKAKKAGQQIQGSLQDQQPERGSIQYPMNIQERASIAMPPPISQSVQEVQVSLLEWQMVTAKEQEISHLKAQIEERQLRIDEMERQLNALNGQAKSMPLESEALKKLRFDNQILMGKLSEYKKAEKGAKELVSDYEQMKMKYFNVLTENSNQKQQLSELIQSKLDNEISINELNEEKQRYIDELYALRMDITRKIEDVAKRNAQIQSLQEELTVVVKRSQELSVKEKEVSQLQTDIEGFLRFFSQVDKHMRTLIKFLRESIARTSDPKTIEHQQKQIKTIESLLEDLRKAVNNREYSGGEASRLIESLFLLSSESLKDVQTSAMLSDKERVSEDTQRHQSVGMKRRKINHEAPDTILTKDQGSYPFSLESAGEEGTILKKQGMLGANPFQPFEDSQQAFNTLDQSQRKKRFSKTIEKGVSFKKSSDFEANGMIRRSTRNKDKAESDVC